jgi:hypothetical protein
MKWILYVAVMTLLVIASPVIGWWHLQTKWHYHPAGSAGVLRDQIITRVPWGITVVTFAIYLALGASGMIAAPTRDWMMLVYGAVALVVLAFSGFLPPMINARQRLTRLRKMPLIRVPVQTARGA